MIRPLRQRHRRIIIALGVILPIAFAIGIVARKPVLDMAVLPAQLSDPVQRFELQQWERNDLFSIAPIQVRLRREQATPGRLAVEFSAQNDFVKPDLIVYWVTENQTVSETIPDNAILLGAFSSSAALPLPLDAEKSGGVLVLYSLADNEVVAVSKPLTFQLSTN